MDIHYWEHWCCEIAQWVCDVKRLGLTISWFPAAKRDIQFIITNFDSDKSIMPSRAEADFYDIYLLDV